MNKYFNTIVENNQNHFDKINNYIKECLLTNKTNTIEELLCNLNYDETEEKYCYINRTELAYYPNGFYLSDHLASKEQYNFSIDFSSKEINLTCFFLETTIGSLGFSKNKTDVFCLITGFPVKYNNGSYSLFSLTHDLEGKTIINDIEIPILDSSNPYRENFLSIIETYNNLYKVATLYPDLISDYVLFGKAITKELSDIILINSDLIIPSKKDKECIFDVNKIYINENRIINPINKIKL